MGATHSKKHLKGKHKKKWLSVGRSASVDDVGFSDCSSSCPQCSHSIHSSKWSSDHSLSYSFCSHHTTRVDNASSSYRSHQQQCAQARWRGTNTIAASDTVTGGLPTSSSHGCLQLYEISNRDYSSEEGYSTMSLNRHVLGKQLLDKPAADEMSKSDEFSGNVKQNHFENTTKENVNPYLQNGDSTIPHQKYARQRVGIDGRDSQGMVMAKMSQSQSCVGSVKDSNCSKSYVSSRQVRRSLSGSHAHGYADKNNVGDRKLTDEQDLQSQWARRKKRAEELRNLRMHLQLEENIKHMTSPHQPQIKQNVHTSVKTTYTHTKVKRTELLNVKDLAYTTAVTKDSITNHKLTSSCTNSATDTTCFDSPSMGDPSFNNPTTQKSVRSKFSRRSGNYRYLDSHPVMTRLQNEQNNRLELMERRMEEIRISAMQEAERKRFAEIFPAKDKDSETQKLLREARESLERLKDAKRKKKMEGQQKQSETGCDEIGEIIPVTVMSTTSTPMSYSNNSTDQDGQTVEVKSKPISKSVWASVTNWPDIDLSKPVTWLWLPFLLFPLVLRMLLILLFNFTFNRSPRRNQTQSRQHNTTSCIPSRDKRK